MNRSSFSYSKRLQTALYPFAFPIVAIVLGFITYQIVNRLATETASTKLTTIANTGATAVSVWVQNHQSAIELLVMTDRFQESAAKLNDAQGEGASRGSAIRSIENEFAHFSKKFDCLGFALLAADGTPLLNRLQSPSNQLKRETSNIDAAASRNDKIAARQEVRFDLKSGVVHFEVPVGVTHGRRGRLLVAISAKGGLNPILQSVSVGENGFAFLVHGDEGNSWRDTWPAGRKRSVATSKMLDAALSAHSAISEANTSINMLGLASSDSSEYVGAQKQLESSNASLIALAERDEVFKATLVLKRILLLILGLSVLASVMNWMYVLRLSNLRSRFSDASDVIRRLGQYNLEEKIGEGGMGVVYRASHSMLQRPTAVKLILPDRASDKSIENFEREVQLTSRLTHPNTIAIYDYGRNEDGIFYYAMEYLNGINLAKLVSMEGPQPWQRVVHILSQVCDSLAEAHACGLIHRDIKPENVMLCQRGNRHDVVKVLDFGLAGDFSQNERSDSTRVQGTPAYMAPESILHPDQADQRVDVYAVGAVGYFLLAGRHIFSGETASSILSQQLNSKPIPLTQRRPEISDRLQSIIMSCLEKDRDNRPGRIDILREELVGLSKSSWTEKDARDGWLRIEERRSTSPPGKASNEPAVHSISKTIEF